MTLDDRGRQAADDARAAVATTDLEALRARVRTQGHGDPGRRRRAAAVVAVGAALLLVALGIGVLVSRQGPTTRTAASTADRASVPVARAESGTAGGRSHPGASTRSAGPPQLTRGNGLVAYPTTGLVDGQAVHLTGTGFAPGTLVVVRECAAHLPRDARAHGAACAPPVRTARTPAAGGPVVVTFRVQRAFPVPRALVTPTPGTVDCGAAPGACVLVMSGSSSTTPAESSVAVAFRPSHGPTTTTP